MRFALRIISSITQTQLLSGPLIALVSQLNCHAFTFKNIFGIFKPPNLMEFSMTFSAIFGLLPSHKKVWRILLISCMILAGVSKTVVGCTIREITKAFMTVIFPFRDNFLLDHCFRIVSIAFSRGLKLYSSDTL